MSTHSADIFGQYSTIFEGHVSSTLQYSRPSFSEDHVSSSSPTCRIVICSTVIDHVLSSSLSVSTTCFGTSTQYNLDHVFWDLNTVQSSPRVVIVSSSTQYGHHPHAGLAYVLSSLRTCCFCPRVVISLTSQYSHHPRVIVAHVLSSSLMCCQRPRHLSTVIPHCPRG